MGAASCYSTTLTTMAPTTRTTYQRVVFFALLLTATAWPIFEDKASFEDTAPDTELGEVSAFTDEQMENTYQNVGSLLNQHLVSNIKKAKGNVKVPLKQLIATHQHELLHSKMQWPHSLAAPFHVDTHHKYICWPISCVEVKCGRNTSKNREIARKSKGEVMRQDCRKARISFLKKVERQHKRSRSIELKGKVILEKQKAAAAKKKEKKDKDKKKKELAEKEAAKAKELRAKETKVKEQTVKDQKKELVAKELADKALTKEKNEKEKNQKMKELTAKTLENIEKNKEKDAKEKDVKAKKQEQEGKVKAHKKAVAKEKADKEAEKAE